MKDNYFGDLALFRFSIIAPIVNNTHCYASINKYCKALANQEYIFNNKKYVFSASCIKNWYLSYKKTGISALEVKRRSDKGMSRKINNETIERIKELRNQFPSVTGTKLYKILIKENYIKKSEVSLSSLLRYLKNNNLKSSQVTTVERRSFEHQHANDSWQSDTSAGPYIIVNGVKYKTYLIMFIDDKSRLITGFDFFFNDNAINMQTVFKDAVRTYGVPKQLFVDNGGPYDNKQLSRICATLGIQLVHAKPYSPESKAKIERVFGTIKSGWMRCVDWNRFGSLKELKSSFSDYLYEEYQNKNHSSFNQSPNNRWHNDYDFIRIEEDEFIDSAFLHRETRKVSKTRTISIEKHIFEVPFKYVGQVIELRYYPGDLSKVFIYENNKLLHICKLLNKVDNSKVKRKNNIDYSKIINKENEAIEMEE